MENAVTRLTLDVQEIDSGRQISAKLGDSARTLLISLTNRGSPYMIDEGCTAVFTAEKPDGTVLFNDCRVGGNCIVYEFTGQTANAEGLVPCEIRLYGPDNRLITSPRFGLLVDGTVYGDDKVPDSSDEFTALTEMVSLGTELIQQTDALRQEVARAAEAAAEAEKGAAQARTTAEGAAQSAAQAANHAAAAAAEANRMESHAEEAAERAEEAKDVVLAAGGIYVGEEEPGEGFEVWLDLDDDTQEEELAEAIRDAMKEYGDEIENDIDLSGYVPVPTENPLVHSGVTAMSGQGAAGLDTGADKPRLTVGKWYSIYVEGELSYSAKCEYGKLWGWEASDDYRVLVHPDNGGARICERISDNVLYAIISNNAPWPQAGLALEIYEMNVPTVGQTLVVTAVDDTGKPTEWSAATIPEAVTDKHINSLIAAALEAVPNAAEVAY